jgi:hypothetical protein
MVSYPGKLFPATSLQESLGRSGVPTNLYPDPKVSSKVNEQERRIFNYYQIGSNARWL